VTSATLAFAAIGCMARGDETTSANGADRVPYVRLEEQGGHLVFLSCLPAGRGTFTADDPTGLRLSGFVFVSAEGEQTRLRMFRLRGDFEDRAVPAQPGTTEQPRAPEFAIALQASSHPDHYVLAIRSTIAVAGKTVTEEARLGRTCCGYYVWATHHGEPLPAGRGTLLTDVMISAPATYRQFERLAENCCRPGFEFVPGSRLSPSVVEEVVAGDKSAPSPTAEQRFQTLLAELDSDQFERRESASAELIQGGRTTLWSLDRLNNRQLTTEQLHRIVHVRRSLHRFSDPHLPFRFAEHGIQELIAEPPLEWLEHLAQSSDAEVCEWAHQKLKLLRSRTTGATTPEPPFAAQGE